MQLSLVEAEACTSVDPKDGYHLQGYLITSLSKKSLAVLKEAGLSSIGFGFVDGVMCSIMTTIKGEVKLTFEDHIRELFTSNYGVELSVRSVLDTFSRLTATPVRLNLYDKMNALPFSREDGYIDIMLNTSPPGETIKLHISKMCGVRIAEPGRQYSVIGNSIGYGMLVRDEDNVVIGQVIDRTFYLFVPVYGDHMHLLDDSKSALFRKVLTRVWNAMRNPPEEEIREVLTIPEEFLGYEDLSRDKQLKDMEESVEGYRRDLRKAEEALIEAQNQLRFGIAMYAGLQKGQKSPKDLVASRKTWKEVLEHRIVERIELVQNGIEVTTKPQFIDYEGRRYPLGRFVVRLSAKFKLTIRCLDSPHPKGVPHPHIQLSGSPCFGNITTTLSQEAFVHSDYARYMLLVLDWIAEGYDHSLAVPPITEWPSEEIND